jgi:HNH endonuclease
MMEAEVSEVDEREQLKQELLSRIVKVDGPMDTPCWLWTGTPDICGYGQFRWMGERWQAHRLSYTCFVGLIPDGLQVNHHCDQPPCIRPDHLYTGTHQDNMDDMVRRGRSPIGEANGFAKLSNEQVASIKFLVGTGRYSQTAIAEPFDVDSTLIRYIALGAIWAHIAPATSYNGPPIREGRGNRGEAHCFGLLTKQEAMTIKRLLLNGASDTYIAYCFGVSRGTIYSIKDGNSWAWLDPLPPDAEIIFPSLEVVADRRRWRRERDGSSEVKLVRRL